MEAVTVLDHDLLGAAENVVGWFCGRGDPLSDTSFTHHLQQTLIKFNCAVLSHAF